MQELVVVSLTGVHILQHDIQLGAEKILHKLVRAFTSDQSLYDNSYYSVTHEVEENKNSMSDRRGRGDVYLQRVKTSDMPVIRRVNFEDEENNANTENVKRGI